MLVFIAQILTLIGWILFLISYYRDKIDELLYLQILACLLDTLSYILLGADAGLFICLIEAVKTYLYYKTNKDDIIFKGAIVIYIIIGIFTIKTWYSLLPVIASILDSYGCSKDSKTATIMGIISYTLWTIYDIIIMSYVGALTDIFVVISNILVLTLGYKKIKKLRKLQRKKINNFKRKIIN